MYLLKEWKAYCKNGRHFPINFVYSSGVIILRCNIQSSESMISSLSLICFLVCFMFWFLDDSMFCLSILSCLSLLYILSLCHEDKINITITPNIVIVNTNFKSVDNSLISFLHYNHPFLF